jgi:hypothetical protein
MELRGVSKEREHSSGAAHRERSEDADCGEEESKTALPAERLERREQSEKDDRTDEGVSGFDVKARNDRSEEGRAGE